MLETYIDGARAVLINITGGPDTSIIDINEAAQLITAAADPEANIIFGAGIDESMDDEVKITVIATGFEKPAFTETINRAPLNETRESAEEEPIRASRPSRYEEEQVSPIFERRPRPERERPPRESADTGYEQREQRRAERQQTRRPRVYQEDGQEPRSQNRRGFTPDVPSFMKRK